MNRTTLSTFIWCDYWPDAQGPLSVGWRRRSEQVLRELDAELGHLEVGRISAADLDAWWGGLVQWKGGHAARTRLIRLRQVFKVVVEKGYRLDNPTFGVTTRYRHLSDTVAPRHQASRRAQ